MSVVTSAVPRWSQRMVPNVNAHRRQPVVDLLRVEPEKAPDLQERDPPLEHQPPHVADRTVQPIGHRLNVQQRLLHTLPTEDFEPRARRDLRRSRSAPLSQGDNGKSVCCHRVRETGPIAVAARRQCRDAQSTWMTSPMIRTASSPPGSPNDHVYVRRPSDGTSMRIANGNGDAPSAASNSPGAVCRSSVSTGA